jgi:hypothetical protein
MPTRNRTTHARALQMECSPMNNLPVRDLLFSIAGEN